MMKVNATNRRVLLIQTPKAEWKMFVEYVGLIEINLNSRVCLLKIPSIDKIVCFLKGEVQSPKNGGRL
jgi:hypothetical protein